MAWPPTIPFAYHSFILFVLLLSFGSRSCYGFGSQFAFDFHHRYSDPVKGILGDEGLPEKGSVEYYVAMAHRDRIIQGRHLAVSNDQSSPLTFSAGNDTYRIAYLGHLHYANVSVGTPSLSFLVALDTGSDLFWLPCDCKTKGGGCMDSIGGVLLNIYSPNSSSTSEIFSCNSSLCTQSQISQCSNSGSSHCTYTIRYLSDNTSTTGILVEDVLYLTTDDDHLRGVTPITFGCGQSQTGVFSDGLVPNGLFGLGMEDVSVPSTLARNGLVSNSFSMCFRPDGLGRITFGNNGSSFQKETPFIVNIGQLHPTYNVSITQIAVGRNSSELGLSVVFDSGTSFTYLTDPAYTFISESFNSQVQNKRYPSDIQIPFEYCYELSPNQVYEVPSVNLTMKGGDQYFVTNPTNVVDTEAGNGVYCLGLLKSEYISIIGQNFMDGYSIVFDRERMVLGWKDSNCYDDENSTTVAVSPSHSPAASPAVAANPEANPSIPVAPAPLSGHSPKLQSLTYALTMLLVSFFVIV